MITEDYVSFETARLLKDKGFNEKVICYYDDGGSLNLNKFVEFQCCNEGYGSGVFAAPTLQMAMKWLREVHDIYIMIDKDFVTENGWHYVVVRKHDWADNTDKGLIQQESNSYAYEFACETAIKYCLEHLI